MKEIIEFFKLLREAGLLASSFIMGALAIAIAIIGTFDLKQSVLTPKRSILLALFGFGLILLSGTGYLLTLRILPPPQPTATIPAHTSRSDIDRLFGEGNWFCFPDRENGLGVRRISHSFTAGPLLRRVDTYQGQYKSGETVPAGVGATVELQNPLPQADCPPQQLPALTQWLTDKTNDREAFTRARINNLVGRGNWSCLAEFPYAVSVNRLAYDLPVAYPITFVTYYDSSGFGVGEIVPKGQPATVWLGRSLANRECSEPALSPSAPYDGWTICWHGKAGYEFLVAYPESSLLQGVDLGEQWLLSPWNNQTDRLANDSLKACLRDSLWYGYDDPPWFPLASFFQLAADRFLLCESGPDCHGRQWEMPLGAVPPPVIQRLLTMPEGQDIQVLGYVSSSTLNVGHSYCLASDWEGCWHFDDTARTMTWIGPTTNSFDIGQDGVALDKIRAGYTAAVSISTPGIIETCNGSSNGQPFSGSCPIVYELEPGQYQIISPGSSGGFRIRSEHTRNQALHHYNAIYQQQGWCTLWQRLVRDGLVEGPCPQAVNSLVKENVIDDMGTNHNLITGIQIASNSEITVHYPACINYGIDGSYATLVDGRIQPWTTNSQVATDVTVLPNSIFSLYLRCDHMVWQ